jgi:asparagine synthase (glutamine-hydrolysing)
MCGIAGYYNTRVEQNVIDSVSASLKHRGPDAQGLYQNEKVGLVHTRLSIIELSPLGSQPYRFENLVLVYNGELYNYQEVREELKKVGYSFLSNSDTEVLIKAFHCWGPACVDRFIGMFAFCIYNEVSNEIFLFRDRVGVKPLYYSYQNGVLFFASELKALLHFPVSREINPEAVALYFRFGFVPDHLSIFSKISKLAPGEYIKITESRLQKEKYWKLHLSGGATHKSEEEWADELESLLISAFKYRMVSDVPVGVFLSGGIDSSLLTAILQKHHGAINTFTIGFDEARFDESVFAKNIAALLRTNHTCEVLKVEKAHQLLFDFYSIYDEPFADTSGIPTAFVTSLAKSHGMKVVLSADGGDELFGGYTHYIKAAQLYNRLNRLPTRMRRGLAKTINTVFPDNLKSGFSYLNLGHKAHALEELLDARSPGQFFEAYVANQSQAEIAAMLTNVHQTKDTLPVIETELEAGMMEWDFRYFLPDDLLVKIDRATMFHSLECREPFLDHRLVEFARGIPLNLKIKNGQGKFLLRKLLARYLPSHSFERKKQGFSIPIFDWFRSDMDALFTLYLSDEKLKDIPILNSVEVKREFKKYMSFRKQGKEYNIEKMWRILSFVMWWQKYMRSESKEYSFHYS